MKIRPVVFLLVLAAVLVTFPVELEAVKKYRPSPSPYPGYFGTFTEDSSCPVATHLITRFCVERPYVYVVFKRFKGAKRFEGGLIAIHGPVIDSTSCSLPVIEADDVVWKYPPPPPCG